MFAAESAETSKLCRTILFFKLTTSRISINTDKYEFKNVKLLSRLKMYIFFTAPNTPYSEFQIKNKKQVDFISRLIF